MYQGDGERERLLYTLFMLAVEDEPFNLEGLITTDELRFTLLFVFSFFLIMSFMMLVQINHTVTEFFSGGGGRRYYCAVAFARHHWNSNPFFVHEIFMCT